MQERVRELEAKLAESIPRAEAERLSAEIEELQKKLEASKSEADSLRADVSRLQYRLAESIPKAESEAKVNELETKLSAARRDLEVANSTIELDAARADAESSRSPEGRGCTVGVSTG